MKLEVPSAPYYPGSQFFNDFKLPIRVIHVENSRTFPDHHHDFLEMIFVRGGTGLQILNNKEYKLCRGDVFIVRKGIHHQYLKAENLDYINILLNSDIPEYISKMIARLPDTGLKLSVLIESEAVSLINRIDQEIYSGRFMNDKMAEACLSQLCCLLLRIHNEDNVKINTSVKTRVNYIIEYLKTENGPSLSAARMAEEAGTSVRNFHRIFRKLTGSSVKDYIHTIRIDKACELLKHTDKSISNISAMVHYEDSNYFSRQFKQIKGVSPSSYRQG